MRTGDLELELIAMEVVRAAPAGAQQAADLGLLFTGKFMLDDRSGLAQPAEDGAQCFAVPVRDGGDLEQFHPVGASVFSPVVDYVVWPVKRSNRVYLRTGARAVLGHIGPQLGASAPVRVHAHPLGWLRHGGDGIVLLSEQIFDACNALLLCRAIIADDPNYGRWLKGMMEKPYRTPAVYVAAATRRAA